MHACCTSSTVVLQRIEWETLAGHLGLLGLRERDSCM